MTFMHVMFDDDIVIIRNPKTSGIIKVRFKELKDQYMRTSFERIKAFLGQISKDDYLKKFTSDYIEFEISSKNINYLFINRMQ